MKRVVKSRLIALQKNKVLVLQKVDKRLRYTLPGGIKKRKETEEATMIREVGEEIKLKLAPGDAQFYLSLSQKSKTTPVIKNYFLVELQSLSISVKEKDKFKAALWVEWKEALPFMDKSDRLAVRSYFKNFGNKSKKKGTYGDQVSPRIAM